MTRVVKPPKAYPETHSARGFIDNRPTIWVILILAAVGGWQYLEMTGAVPTGLWDRVPAYWKALLAATGMLIVAGAIALFVAGRVEERREPYRAEAQGEQRLIHETAVLERTLGIVLLAAGVVFLGFGIAGAGWPSWLVLALGLLLALLSTGFIYSRRRYVVERGRLVLESGTLSSWRAEGSCSWEPGSPPRLEIKEGGLSGGWGQYQFIPDSLLVDGQALAGSTRNARKLLPLLQQAIAETGA